MSSHLVVAVSAHGFGHIGQTAPVVHALKWRRPNLKITVRSAAPNFKICERFGREVEQQNIGTDVGIIQVNALEIQIEQTATTYQVFHNAWSDRIASEAQALTALHPDLVLANIPYLCVTAAVHAGIPAVALCSLNWADIYRYYYENRRPEADRIIDEMLSAYNAAERFLQPEPRMPMEGITNGLSIGPIAQLGRPQRERIAQAIGATQEDRLVMISLGGMDVRLPVEHWPDLSGLHLIVPQSWRVKHPRISALETIGMPFADVMASCDALVCKPGYGSFVEAACLGIPVLYLDRPDWPEVPYLVQWLEKHGRCLHLQSQHLEQGSIRQLLTALWSVPPKPVTPSGVDEAADYLANFLK